MSAFIAIFSGGIVALVVWMAGGPGWAIVGFGFSVLLLTAISEDHAHGAGR